ncbi:hypothetical protein CXB51_035043 [Gossypium anomalum]|uniref:Retrotransposon gag domain-containing protein n=1 Tax=Gossypium anomalum TaxID=47600 RepID=A0A8J5Y2H3_9ROSI|nr:hypothetical protein CXB51_035043 [Gossypium anomalum]
MAENQDNPLPPAIPAELANQNPAPRTMYDYAKPNFTGTESSIMDLETLYDAWERYKDLLRRCPHYGLPLWLQVQMFYNGVNPSTRQMIDIAAGGTINNKTPEEASEFIKEMSLNNYQWEVMRTKPTKTTDIYNIDSVTVLSNQVELLNKKIDGLLSSTQVHSVMRCDPSRGGVHTEYPPLNPTTEEEQVNYMGNNNFRSQNNPYSNTYTAGWKNHPNFTWGGQGKQRPQNPQGFQQPPYQQEKKLNLEEMLSKFISVSETHFQNTETALKNQQASIQGLETQIGQLSKLISERPQGSLPSNTEPNPKEQLNANNVQAGCVEPEPESRQENVASKGDGELFNKLKDPGSFTIPCLIGSLDVNHTLADLEASINIMPYKMFKQLGLRRPKQTRMSIQLAKTIRFPKGRLFLATAKTIIDVGTSELTLCVGDETITLQARNSSNTSKMEGNCPYQSAKTNDMTQPTVQKLSLKEVHEPCSSNNIGLIHEERRLQIEELDEWVGDKVLLDVADPHIITTNPNEETPLTVLCIFPFGTVEVSHPKFGTFKVNNTRLKLYCDKIDSRNKEYELLKPP